MIKPEDAEFHFNKDSHWQWVETIALPFHVPGTTVSGIVYFMARPMLGVCMCDISLHDRITDLWEEQLYIDNQQHLPCPKSLLSFSLTPRLKVERLSRIMSLGLMPLSFIAFKRFKIASCSCGISRQIGQPSL